MASYHLSVKTIKRSAGRTATAAAAYRAGERIECQREGRLHDYTRKSGIEETFIVAPETAPAWAQDRAALWNAAEESETWRNAVTAREWELSLPSEISAEDRSQITREFAEQLVSRYGVAVDVAIHAPNREGDQRNHHAHVLTTTRQLEPDGFTTKTRVLDSAKTGGAEIEQMRGVWAELQNRALEMAFQEMRERLDVAREVYGMARGEGQGRVSAGLAALRAAAGKGGRDGSSEEIKDRLAQIVERDHDRDAPDQAEPSEEKRESVKDRLSSLLDRSKPVEIEESQSDLDKDRENDKDLERNTDRGKGHSL